MTEVLTDPVQTRPGGRSARVRATVHRAVIELLAEQPAEALTIPVIAARAGVHPTTVYRRWGTVAHLLSDAASSRFSGGVVVPDTGSLEQDLRRWVSDVANDLTDPDVIGLMRATIALGPDASNACIVDRHTQLAAIIEREHARGGKAPTLMRAVDALLGPLYYHAIFVGDPASAEWARELVTALLATI
jgi:AcrR family transcriptional regulator